MESKSTHAWHACKRVSEFWSFGFLLQITVSALHHAHLLIFNATNPCHLSDISGRTFLPQFGSFQRKERDDCNAGEREQLQIRNPTGEPMHSIRKTFLVQSRAGKVEQKKKKPKISSRGDHLHRHIATQQTG